MGVVIIPNYDLVTDPEVTISEKENESGPSGGLMMAISIYDKLTGENLSKGDKIIGTGTIDMDGTVGEIGGVKYKLIGAVNNHAKVFICPTANYEEAMNIAKEKKYNIEIVSVNNFDEAVNYLRSR
jgi:PDZ domain-containing protein